MLYDKKWDKQIETKPSVAGFVAWLEGQDGRKSYEYSDCVNCAVGQYLRTLDLTWQDLFHHSIEGRDLIFKLDGVAQTGLEKGRLTFGSALKAARKLLTTEK